MVAAAAQFHQSLFRQITAGCNLCTLRRPEFAKVELGNESIFMTALISEHQHSSLFQEAEGSMLLFIWHRDHKAVSQQFLIA